MEIPPAYDSELDYDDSILLYRLVCSFWPSCTWLGRVTPAESTGGLNCTRQWNWHKNIQVVDYSNHASACFSHVVHQKRYCSGTVVRLSRIMGHFHSLVLARRICSQNSDSYTLYLVELCLFASNLCQKLNSKVHVEDVANGSPHNSFQVHVQGRVIV